MKNIIATILFATSVGLFFVYTNPLYVGKGDASEDISQKGVRELLKRKGEYETAKTNSGTILKKRDELIAQRNSFSQSDRKNITQLIPDNIDNVQLILDLNGIAKRYSMLLKGIRIEQGPTLKEGQIGVNKDQLSSISVSFKVGATYETFLEFLRDLETSLRIVDVTKLSFKPTDTGIYNFDVTIKTYWLKK
jgi:Tfp pilus assembly protein PilO